MEIHELRIGNIINCIEYGIGITTIVESGSDIDSLKGKENFIPMELNDNWLLKLGFIKLDVSDPFYIHSDFMSIKISLDLKMIAFNNLNLHNVKFGFVHQLQNLFFALTGHELKIK